MVPLIVELGSKLRIPPLVDGSLLGNYQVGIAQRWSAAKRVRQVAKLSGRWIADVRRVEPEVAILPRIQELYGASRRTGGTRACRARSVGIFEEEAALQLKIVLRLNPDRESALVSDDCRSAPAVQGFPLEPVILRNRKFPVRTENKSMLSVEQRKPPGRVEVEGVQLVFKRGTLIDRLAERVGSRK